MSHAAIPPHAPEAIGCFGKVRYATPAAAMRALNLIRNLRGQGRRLEKYSCQHCHGWHLGGSVK